MDKKEQRVTELYHRLWDEIDDVRTSAIVDQFLSNVDLPREWFQRKLCLDVGCGSGFAVWAIQSIGGKCLACDLDHPTLVNIGRHLSAACLPVPLTAATALALPFADARFDFVHCNGVLHHTRDPRKGMKEVIRVTKPGGTIFVSLYGRGGLYNMAVQLGRMVRPLIPYGVAAGVLTSLLGKRRVPNSFMPAKASILDNMYVPIRHSYRAREIMLWLREAGLNECDVVRTRTTIYDHTKPINRLIHGEGYLQFRVTKPQ